MLEKIKNKTAKIAVLGLGYVGLPEFVNFCEEGYSVIGIDIDAQKIAKLSTGTSYIDDISDEQLQNIQSHYTVSTDMSLLQQADVVIIAVPTPTTDKNLPDNRFIEQATQSALANVKAQQLIVLVSSVMPETTRKYLATPLIEQNWTIGEDVYIAYSPERIDPGNAIHRVENTPRLVAGYSPTCLTLVQALFAKTAVPMSSLEAAELTKLYENTFRFVNIALANELAFLCQRLGFDVEELVAAAGTKPFGFMPFSPSLKIGGHCIPVDPYYLTHYALENGVKTPLIDQAGLVNDRMLPTFFNSLLYVLNQQGLALKGLRVGLIGATYKKNIRDTRMATSHQITDELVNWGATVSIFDDLVVGDQIGKCKQTVQAIDSKDLQAQDVVILLVNHDSLAIDELASQAKLFINPYDQGGVA